MSVKACEALVLLEIMYILGIVLNSSTNLEHDTTPKKRKMFYHSITMIQIYINKPNESFRNTLSDIEKAKKKNK